MTDGDFDAELASSLADAALEAAGRAGVGHAEVRVESIRSHYVALRDAALEGGGVDRELGIGLRLLDGG